MDAGQVPHIVIWAELFDGPSDPRLGLGVLSGHLAVEPPIERAIKFAAIARLLAYLHQILRRNLPSKEPIDLTQDRARVSADGQQRGARRSGRCKAWTRQCQPAVFA